jgi:hypothetical protein
VKEGRGCMHAFLSFFLSFLHAPQKGHKNTKAFKCKFTPNTRMDIRRHDNQNAFHSRTRKEERKGGRILKHGTIYIWHAIHFLLGKNYV